MVGVLGYLSHDDRARLRHLFVERLGKQDDELLMAIEGLAIWMGEVASQVTSLLENFERPMRCEY